MLVLAYRGLRITAEFPKNSNSYTMRVLTAGTYGNRVSYSCGSAIAPRNTRLGFGLLRGSDVRWAEQRESGQARFCQLARPVPVALSRTAKNKLSRRTSASTELS